MVDNNNLELRLCISIPLHDSLKTQIIIEFKAKKTLSFLKGLVVDNSTEISNIGFTPRGFELTFKMIETIQSILK